jgi:hypothetical protein
MFKSISENRIRKNINFENHFSKTIYESKIGISERLEETRGEKRKNHRIITLIQPNVQGIWPKSYFFNKIIV